MKFILEIMLQISVRYWFRHFSNSWSSSGSTVSRHCQSTKKSRLIYDRFHSVGSDGVFTLLNFLALHIINPGFRKLNLVTTSAIVATI